MTKREEKLRELLKNFNYPSLSRPGTSRPLMQHHIDALVETLVPFIDLEVEAAESEALFSC